MGIGRRAIAWVAMAGVAATALLAGTALAQDSNGDDEPLTFIVGYTQPPNTMNPLRGLLTSEYEAYSNMYPLLFNFDADTLVATAEGASLAAELPSTENGGISQDGLTYTIQIRDGFTWSDGEPITAADVAFTYNLILEERFSNFTSYLPFVDEISAPDDTTLIWRTTRPSVAPFVPPWIYILPEHVWGALGDKDAIKSFDNFPDPVVAGPFTLTEWRKGESLTMEKVEGSYAGDPMIDRVIYQFFQNSETMVQALKAGTIDFAEAIPADLFDTLQDEPDIATNVGAGLTFSHFSFLQCYTQRYCSQPTSTADPHPAIADPVVREAVTMSINKDQLVERALGGYGTPGTTPVGPTQAYWHWEPGADEAIQWDIPGANQLLDDAGYLDTDGDDVRNMPGGGENLEWRFVLPNDSDDRVKAAQLISGWLAQIGIEANPQVLTTAKMTDVWYANDYDVQMWGWGPDPDPDFILSTYTTNQCGVWSDTCWSNPAYDRLYKEQQSAGSPEERQAIIQEMQQLWYDGDFQVVVWNDNDLQAYRSDRWEGFVPQPAPNEDGTGGSILYQYGLWSYLGIRPVGAEGGGGGAAGGGDGGGVPAVVWIALGAAVLIGGGIVMSRRRRADDDDMA
jgi:peptide/nickel transport system substrate-binding protein